MSDSTPLDRHTERVAIWACLCCDLERPSVAALDRDDGCGDNARFMTFSDTEQGRCRLAHYRETYRSDLLK